MRFFVFLSMFLFMAVISAENSWITQRASEFGTASGAFIHVGTKTKGYAMGTADNGQGGKSPYCFVMTDGMNWND